MGVERFGTVNNYSRELGVEFFENLFAKTSANVADSFVGVSLRVVTGEEESSVDGSTLSTTIVGS